MEMVGDVRWNGGLEKFFFFFVCVFEDGVVRGREGRGRG